MTLGIAREGLAEPLRELGPRAECRFSAPAPGLIMLDREHLQLMDIRAEAQRLRSADQELRDRRRDAGPAGRPDRRNLHPRAVGSPSTGPGVRDSRGRSKVTQSPPARGSLLAVSFHTELGDDERPAPLVPAPGAKGGAPRRALPTPAERPPGRTRSGNTSRAIVSSPHAADAGRRGGGAARVRFERLPGPHRGARPSALSAAAAAANPEQAASHTAGRSRPRR